MKTVSHRVELSRAGQRMELTKLRLSLRSQRMQLGSYRLKRCPSIPCIPTTTTKNETKRCGQLVGLKPLPNRTKQGIVTERNSAQSELNQYQLRMTSSSSKNSASRYKPYNQGRKNSTRDHPGVLACDARVVYLLVWSARFLVRSASFKSE